jgi:uracil-DNA glycosylase family protein
VQGVDEAQRNDAMLEGAKPYLPARMTIASLRKAVQSCRGCALYQGATQPVFGTGRVAHGIPLMVIGEAPRDKEDLQGKPFVGPAGALLDRAFGEAGIERRKIYLTNAVKHFKWIARGKKRLHAKPSAREVSACQPWLEAELVVVRPQRIFCLGAVAAQALLGSQFRITRQRGQVIESAIWGLVVASWHPAAILRAPSQQRDQMYRQLVADLGTAMRHSS